MRKDAWMTYNRNQQRLARARARERTTRKQVTGKTYKTVSSATHVIYCASCGAPVVDSKAARARHAKRGNGCATAMKGE